MTDTVRAWNFVRSRRKIEMEAVRRREYMARTCDQKASFTFLGE